MSKEQERLRALLESIGKITIALAASQLEIANVLNLMEQWADDAGLLSPEDGLAEDVGMN